MRWIPWRRETKAAKPERKERVLGLTEELGSFLTFGEGSASTPSSALSLYEKSTAVSVPVNMVAEAFSIINPVLMLDDEMVKEHPVLDLIRKPSPWFTRELFLDVIAKNYLVTGELAVVGLGNIGVPPLEMAAISPKSMTPVQGMGTDFPGRWSISGNTLAGTYEADFSDRRVRYFDGPLRELAIVRGFSTRNNSMLRGQSPLLSASREARSHILGTEHNVQLLERGGRVSLVFHFEEDMNEDDFEETKTRVKDQFGGASKAGEIIVTAGQTLKIQEASVAPKDMDYPNLHKLAMMSTAMVFRIPLPLVTETRQTLNNYQASKTALYDDAVIPLSRRIFGGLSDFLLPRFGVDPARATLALNPEDVPALVTRRMEEMIKRRQLQIESTNELRALIGREPAEGGDTIMQPATLVPIGTDLLTDDNDPDRDDDDPSGVETDRD